MKRYVIVEVDGVNCQLKNDLSDYYKTGKFCNFGVGADGDCKDNCDRYGDTREQLIAKVEQVLKQQIPNEWKFIYGDIVYDIIIHGLATKIVEFLGVE